MSDNRKILIIGIDGGSWTVLKPVMEQGYMPFLKSLVDKGASGILESTIPAITPAAWGAFQTGKKPGKTGVFDFAYWDKEQYESRFVSSLDLGTTIWDIISDYGKRVAVVNVPMTYPPKSVNGYLISGLVTPSMESDFTWPPELKSELLKAVPGYHIFDLAKSATYRSEQEHIENFTQQLTVIIENRTKAALWILEKEPLDVFMVHFQATDVLQHVFWHYLDNSHPLFEASKQKMIFEKFYRRLDQKIETIHHTFCKSIDEPLAVLLSDHGFQSHYKRFNLGNWLVKEGYLILRKQPGDYKTPLLKKITRFLKIGRTLKQFLPTDTVDSIDKKYISKSELFDWKKSVAYSAGRSGEGFAYCLPGKRRLANEAAEEIRQKIMQIKDAETGKPVAKKVWLKTELYQGDKTEHLPDLTIEPQDGYSFTGYYQPGQELFHTVNAKDDMHMGKHHRDGIFIATGKGIAPNKKLQANIIDLAPSLLAYLEIPIPDAMDGKAIPALFNTTALLTSTPSAETNLKNSKQKDNRFSKEENVEIENRLKDLGYL